MVEVVGKVKVVGKVESLGVCLWGRWLVEEREDGCFVWLVGGKGW